MYIFVILVVSHFGFEDWTVVLIAPVPGHYANTPMQYTAIFHCCKNVNFQMKNSNIFHFLLLKH